MKIKKYLPLVIGSIVVVFLILASLIPTLFTPYGLKESFSAYQSPSLSHICGTDDLGYDIYTEIIYATRNTLFVAIISSLLSLSLALITGVVAGYYDNLFSHFIELVSQVNLLIPSFIVALCLVCFFNSGLLSIALIIALVTWSSSSRIIMVKVRNLKKEEYIQTLIYQGYSSIRIMLYHILPNIKSLIYARLIALMSRAIMFESTLAFLGLGDLINPSLGTIMYLQRKLGAFSLGAYYTLVFPSLMIFIINIALALILQYLENRDQEVKGGTQYVR